MKRRTLILSSVVIVLVVAALWWLMRPVSNPPPMATIAATNQNPAPNQAASPLSTYKVPGTGKYQGLNDPRWKWWSEMEKRDPAFEWKMPISFYGKVLDGNDQPVAEVDIRYGWNDTTGSHERFDKSDASGLFSLSGISGKGVSVSVSKIGYHIGKAARGSFEYAAFFESNYYEPDASNPVIFRLVKKIDAEPLVIGNAFNTISYEQGTYYYDLQHGRLSRQPSAGDGLKITITRSQAAQGQPFDWTWTVDGVKATVRPTTDEFPQSAPTDAYVPSWKTEEKADAENFQRERKIRLYVHTTAGCYAVVDLQLSHPNKREIGPTFRVKSFLNPKPGSRNMEFDPAKVVKTP